MVHLKTLLPRRWRQCEYGIRHQSINIMNIPFWLITLPFINCAHWQCFASDSSPRRRRPRCHMTAKSPHHPRRERRINRQIKFNSVFRSSSDGLLRVCPIPWRHPRRRSSRMNELPTIPLPLIILCFVRRCISRA